jgi:DNA repair exonuclease SbcCD nuclease subunit
MIKFLHVADVHIGKERLEGALPSRDFADAFNGAVDAALAEKVDFLLIAGDFFDKARIEPHHLSEGESGLRRLHEAGIPVVAVEGNHDVVSTYDERPSWLSYLNDVGLLRLLRTEFRDGKPVMKEWTDADRRGNWLDLPGARIYGAGWFGASTARRLELLAPHLQKKGFTILLLHAGVSRMPEEFSMITPEQLAVVRDRVDYVALGHMHRRYVVDGYAHNPGALEHWELKEATYEKGYWLVETRPTGGFEARPGAVAQRPVHLATLSCNGMKSVDEVMECVARTARTWKVTPETAVQLKLTGFPDFNAAEIDRKKVEETIVQATGCKAADVLPLFGRPAGSAAEESESLPREVLEAEEIAKLVAETGRYQKHADLLADLVRCVLGARTDEELYAELLQRAAPLLEDETCAPP